MGRRRDGMEGWDGRVGWKDGMGGWGRSGICIARSCLLLFFFTLALRRRMVLIGIRRVPVSAARHSGAIGNIDTHICVSGADADTD